MLKLRAHLSSMLPPAVGDATARKANENKSNSSVWPGWCDTAGSANVADSRIQH